MRNLPRDLRDTLQAVIPLHVTAAGGQTRNRSDGQTEKVLFKLHDGQLVETVLMKYERRRTLCISTQAGCAMGCVFCATGQMGFFRHLQAGEIVAQVLLFRAPTRCRRRTRNQYRAHGHGRTTSQLRQHVGRDRYPHR